ncbi:hypothetical protein [Streptomyces sp. NBC_00078]|uniref:hypothetical protein n=1 Tax=unclassified Streptomyces TaxID=2593676 RepID=UPI002258B9B9|nr:hypothetical protein [Streptomyces sp. NBC_00078]MCX5423909.1 hypothetical protein [Streptomyces sp. NBC_00078]
MKRSAIPALSLALPFCLALLTGCASHDSTGRGPVTASGAPEPPTGGATPGRADYTYRLPIAAYSYSDAEYEVIESAQQVMARDCMRNFGLPYRPPGKSAPAAISDRRYGLSDMDDANRYGYRLPPQPPEPEPKLTADQKKVLYGSRSREIPGEKNGRLEYRGKAVPDTGCLGSSIKKFAEPYAYPAGVTAASNISTDSYKDSMRDSDIKSLFTRWSACMKEKGYDYASPMDPFRTPAFTQGEVTEKERKTAAADVTCKRSTNLLESWLDTETRIQKGMIRKHTKVLQRLKELHREKVEAARKLTGGA